MRVFDAKEQAELIAAKDMFLTAEEILKKKLSQQSQIFPPIFSEIRKIENVIQSVVETHKVLRWIAEANEIIQMITDKQREINQYTKEFVEARDEILRSTPQDIIAKSYKSASKDIRDAIEEMEHQRSEFMEKGALPEIIRVYDTALNYAHKIADTIVIIEERPMKTVGEYIKKAEGIKQTLQADKVIKEEVDAIIEQDRIIEELVEKDAKAKENAEMHVKKIRLRTVLAEE